MKKIILPLLILLTVFACNTNQVTITGKIANPLEKYITIQNGEKTDTIALSENGSFSAELNIGKECLAYLKNGGLNISLYLIPGTQINMDFDIEEFNNNSVSESIFSGDGSKESAFMFKLRNKSLQEEFQELMKMPVEKFESKLNHAYDVLTEEIEKFNTENSSSQEFIETVTLLKNIDFANKYLYYVQYHKSYVPGDKAPTLDYFEKYFEKVPFREFDKYKNILAFRNFMDDLFWMKIDKKVHSFKIKKRTIAYANKYIDVIAGLDIPDGLKTYLGQSFLKNFIYLPDSIQAVYVARYKELLYDKKAINDFKETLATVEKTRPGNNAPSFKLPDIDGNMVSSESLIGKVVYINVWASDCGPCTGEFTDLEWMRSNLKEQPIAIVNISIDINKETWKTNVINRKLGGIHLFAKGGWKSDIVSDYAIKKLPRHIIIDKEGKIVDPKASFAGDPATLKKLLEVAKE